MWGTVLLLSSRDICRKKIVHLIEETGYYNINQRKIYGKSTRNNRGRRTEMQRL